MEDNVLQEVLINNYINNTGSITKEQIGGPQFAQWSSLIELIHTAAKSLNRKNWATTDELRKYSECTEIYDAAAAMYTMLGTVNGYGMAKPHDLDLLAVAYVRDCIKSQADFRLLIERMVARELLVQKLKTEQILADENNDIKLLRKIKRTQNRKRRRQLEHDCEKTVAGTVTEEPIKLSFRSFVVVCNIFKCNKNHNVEPIRALVETVDSFGENHVVEVPAGYCKDCNIYFLLESDFKRVRAKGILLCQMVSYEHYKNNATTTLNEMELKAESVLHQSGYNVSAADDLTSVQRQEILRRVIDSELYSISGLLSFLDWLIERNKKVTNKNMNAALGKWEEDRKYIAAYRSNEQRRVGVERIGHAKQCE